MILRLYGKAGQARLDVSPDITLEELKSQIAGLFNAIVTELAVSTDAQGNQLLHGDSRKVKEFGFENGQQLWIHTRGAQQLSSIAPASKPEGPAALASGQSGISIIGGKPMTKVTSSASVAGSRLSDKSSSRQQQRQPHKKAAAAFAPFERALTIAEFDTARLPLGQNLRPLEIVAGGANKLPPTVTLKHQPYRHVDHLEVMNTEELQRFVHRWRVDMDMNQQRAGILIGYYREDPHYEGCGIRAVVEAISIPEQLSSSDDVELVLNDPGWRNAERVAKALGLEVVGWVFTHLPRNNLIAAKEIVRMAKLQLQYIHENVHYTGYPVSTIVTMTIAATEKAGGEPAPDAFQISDLGLAMYRDGLLDEDKAGHDSTVFIRQPRENEMMPTVLENGKEVTQFDADWVLVRVNESAPREIKSFFKRSSFPSHAAASFTDVKEFLNSAPANYADWEKICDFHFLVFVASQFGVESAESLCHAIVAQGEVDRHFLDILKSLS